MECAVYIMTNRHRTVFYVGVTSNLRQRLAEHKTGLHPSSFTKKYNVDRLVYVECGSDIKAAIAREKQLKGWTRAKKVALIKTANPDWHDLGSETRLSHPLLSRSVQLTLCHPERAERPNSRPPSITNGRAPLLSVTLSE
jgi:putative endonuclease